MTVFGIQKYSSIKVIFRLGIDGKKLSEMSNISLNSTHMEVINDYHD